MGKAARRVCWDVKKQSGYRGLGTEGRMVGPSHTGRTYMLSKVRVWQFWQVGSMLGALS
jgi:hypothetical protein